MSQHRNPPWSRDEHIIALDFYLRHAPHIPGATSQEIRQLSALLNRLQKQIGGVIADKFRNTSGVYMKLMNFRRFDPGYKGVGLANGNKDEEVVWNLYAEKQEELSRLAEHIASFALEPDATVVVPADQMDADEEANEGAILSRVHRYRERDRELVKKKRLKVTREEGRLICQACSFDFGKVYGERGQDFIECHHTKPVSQLAPGETTKLSDLVLLCSNCHRIVHRKRPWLTFDELSKLVSP